MDVIQSVIMVGVAIIGIAIITYVSGGIMLSMPAFTGVSGGASTTLDFTKQAWNNTMQNVSTNSISAFQLTSISPLVLGAALIISILLGVFVYTKM